MWELCELFLQAKRALVDTGELSPRTWQTYKATTDSLLRHLGRDVPAESIGPVEFDSLRARLSKVRKAVALGNEIQRVRTLFKFGHESGYLKEPAKFGTHFKRPSKRAIRAARHAAGKRMFEPGEVRRIYYSDARVQLRAMAILALNCGFGQTDIANLPMSAIHGDWVEFPRVKTAVPRRCPLWPESMELLQEVLANRPRPRRPEFAGLLFLTRAGQPWVRNNANGTPDDNIGKEFTKLLKELGIKRKGVNFYGLRHTFATIGGEAKDLVAVDWIMGHVPGDIGGAYREIVSDDRLLAVTNTVRRWLFPVPFVD